MCKDVGCLSVCKVRLFGQKNLGLNGQMDHGTRLEKSAAEPDETRTQCAICFESLGPSLEAYVKDTTEDIDVCENVFRLKCGHAFHTNCVVRSLRMTPQCPSCRSSNENHVSANVDVRRILGTLSNVLDMELDLLIADDTQQVDSNVPTNLNAP